MMERTFSVACGGLQNKTIPTRFFFFFGLKIEYDNKHKILPIQTSG